MSWDRLCNHKSIGGLGFKNFRDFNLAMLGKQGWRLMSKPESLVTKVYKVRYFPKGDFLESENGYNPSFIWRSLWKAKDLVKFGTRWRIGSGTKVQIIGQP